MKKAMMLVFLLVLFVSIAQQTPFTLYVEASPTYISHNYNQREFPTLQGVIKANEGGGFERSSVAGPNFKRIERLYDLTSVHERSDELVIGIQSDRYDELIDLIHRSGAKLARGYRHLSFSGSVNIMKEESF